MSIIVACNNCGGSLKIPEQGLGKIVKCPLCQKTFTAQAASGQSAPAPQGSGPPASAPPSSGTKDEAVVVVCASCQRSLKIARTNLGRTVECPLCKKTFMAQLAAAANKRGAGSSAAPGRVEPAPPPLPDTAVAPGRAPRAGASRADRPAPLPPDDDDPAPARRGRPLIFKVHVKNDPNGKLKGQFRATATGDGLRLQQGKKWDLRVPVGSETRYDKGNALTLDIEGRPVQVAIVSFILYKERLARDLAGLLRGERRRLDPGAYRIPWYLFAPAVLPLGIPLITLGGAIPGALGCGLAGGCVAIMQRERWSVPVRLAAVFGLVVAGYVGLAVFLIAVGKFRQPVQAVTRPQPAPPPAPDPRPRKTPDAPIIAKKDEGPSKIPDAQGRVFLPGDAVALAFAPNDPNTLVTASSNRTIRLWNTAEIREIAAIPFKGTGQELTGMAVAPDGARAVVIRHGGALLPVDLKRHVWEPAWQEAQPAQISQWAVAFARDGQSVATAHGDRTVKIWDVASHSLRHTLNDHKDQVHSVAMAPDSITVASGDGETVRLWNARTGMKTGSFQAQNGGGGNLPALWALAFSPDGKILAAGSNDGTVRLRDLAANREQARLTQGFPVGALAFSSDGARLASAGFGGTVIVWDTVTGAKSAELDLKVPRIHGLAFQPGRNRLAITGSRVILWDVPADGALPQR